MISIWERETFYRDTDICIAGGGLMALWTAYELKKRNAGLRITIVEALPIPALASTRNAGFACFGSPSELWADIESMGADAAWQVMEQRYKGILKIREVLGDKAIDYDPCGGFEVFAGKTQWQGSALTDRLELLNKGFREITGTEKMYQDHTDRLPVQGLKGFTSMAGNRVEGGLHSGKMVQALLEHLRQEGVIYLTGHRVAGTISQGNGLTVIIKTDHRGQVELKAGQMLWATNAALSIIPGLGRKVEPARGQVLLSPPIDNLALYGTFHGEEGYYYFRHLGNRLLIGGARHLAFKREHTLHDAPSDEIRNHLQEYIRRHLPQAAALIGQQGWMHWAGIMGIGHPKEPLVKQLQPGIWAALACNGMGVALTPMVAEEVAAQMLANHR